jgi:hypothetical protein
MYKIVDLDNKVGLFSFHFRRCYLGYQKKFRFSAKTKHMATLL